MCRPQGTVRAAEGRAAHCRRSAAAGSRCCRWGCVLSPSYARWLRFFGSLAALAAVLCGCIFSSTGNAFNPPTGGIPVPSSQQVQVTPNTLDFTALGAGAARSVSVFQSTLTPSYSETDTCSGVATIAQTGFSKGTATYSVTPSGAGGCTATFTGVGSNTGTLTISSAPYGSVTPTPSSFSFLGTGATYAQNLDISQVNYTGTYGESDTCSGVVTVSATSNADGSAVYAVTPVAAGSCQITITGGSGKTAIVGVTVTTTNLGIQ